MKGRAAILSVWLWGLTFATGCQVHPNILYKDGLQQYRQGDLTRAIATFRQAYEVRPGDTNTCYWLGRCYLDLAQKEWEAGRASGAMRFADKALFYLNSAIKAAPAHSPALEAKAQALQLKGDAAEAAQTAQWIAETLTPTAATMLAKAQAYTAAGDADRAMLAYRQAIALEPQNPKAHEAFGRFLLKVGRRDQAIEHLQEAYRLKPTMELLQTLWDLHALPE